MQGKVERFSLADGEDAVIHELRAPLGAGAEALNQFWSGWDAEQTSGLFRTDTSSRLAAREDIGDRWYVATTIEGIVCGLELSRSNRIPHLGSLHQIYTAPNRREQGLARHVLDVALERFSTDGGQAVIAQCTRDTPAYKLLASLGFEDYLAMPEPYKRVTMRLVLGDAAAFEERYFSAVAPDTVARRPLRRSDKSALLHLFSHPVPFLIRYYALHMYGSYGFEESVLVLLDALERGLGTSVLGVAAEGTPAALGTVLPADLPTPPLPYREHVRLLDLFARPGFEDALGPVLEALLVRADVLPGVRRLLSVVDSENVSVRTTLEEAGFVESGMLHDYALLGDQHGDAVFYELTRAEPDKVEQVPSEQPAETGAELPEA
ncbi:MAG: GCN5-related N-acetyltransferase [Chloroflexi bacterium]|nr:GCN5-related N-acetyltransferase [Chloroflexota bacterium]MDB5075455.1 GCN5-related N-acetyltransferase [Chloroflexota bacterium]